MQSLGPDFQRTVAPGNEAAAMAKPLSVWIVILNWNGLADTLACLESLQHLHYAERRVVVVDNGSTDGSVAALRRAAPPPAIEIIEAGRTLGSAGGNNLGIRYALDRGADFILVLNNDTTVAPRLLNELVGAAEQHPEAACFGPWVFYMHDRHRLWWAGTVWSSESLAFTWPGKGRLASEVSVERTTVDIIIGAALFFRASLPRQIGLLDERFFLVHEESDWCCRARRAGFGCMTVPTAQVWHKVGPSFGGEDSPLFTYFFSRNKLLWAEKNASRREWWQILCRALRRLYPVPRIDRGAAGSMHKALLWAVDGYAREWSRKARDPQEVAHRRGVLDYAFRRFGDCPPGIRALTQTWIGTRERATASSGLGG
jgi:GT2 family glycosyltransferase